MGNSFRKNALLFSIFFAIVISIPVAVFQLSPDYQGVYPSGLNDEEHYDVMVRRVAEGEWRFRNPYLYEDQLLPAYRFGWYQVVIGMLYRALPLPFGWFVWVVRTVAVALALYILLRIFEQESSRAGNAWWMAVGVSWFIAPSWFGREFFSFFLDFLRGGGPWNEFLQGYHFINPVTTVVALLLGIFAHQKFDERPSWGRGATLGLLFAGMNYFYPYFWIFLSVYLGWWCIAYLIKRDWVRLRVLMTSLGGGLVLSLPHFFEIRAWMGLFSKEFPLAISSHAPIFEKTVLAAFAIFIISLAIKRLYRHEALSRADWVLFFLGLTSITAVNQHVITGILIQPMHFFWLTDLPVAGVMVFAALKTITEKLSCARELGVAAATVGVGMAFAVQAVAMQHTAPVFIELQRFAPAFAEIKHRGETVVYADERIAELIPIYTSAYVSFAPHAATYPTTSLERKKWAWFVSSYLDGLRDPNRVREEFFAKRNSIGRMLFEGEYYRDLCGSYGCFPDAVFDDLIKEYQFFLTQNFEHEWFRYRLDAILWDERSHPNWYMEQYPFLKKVWQGDGVSLWKHTSVL